MFNFFWSWHITHILLLTIHLRHLKMLRLLRKDKELDRTTYDI